jgi:DNA gyrase subunit A
MGRTAAGVRGMRLKAGDEVVSADPGRGDDALLIVSSAGYAKRTQIVHFPRKGRGTQGVIGVKINEKKGKVVAAFMVGLEDEIVAIASNGVTIRTEVKQISSQGRAATGVRLMNVDDGAVVASVAPILSTDEE